MSIEERKALLAAWVAASGAELVVIAHVGCESLVETKELAAHAQAVGASAISVMPPVFFKPSSIEILIRVRGCLSKLRKTCLES